MDAAEPLRRLVAGTLMPGFVGTSLPEWIKREYAAGLRAVCLYGANVVEARQVSSLTTSLHDCCPRMTVALDEEGGDVTRLHYRTGSPEPGNALLGRLDDLRLTRDSAARIGAQLTSYGITLDLAPVVDVNSTADNPVIGVRSFGADPTLVARHTVAWLEGLQRTGVAGCAKHFPGHGDTVADSHLAVPVVEAPLDLLETRELAPFRAAVGAGVACIMTSHVVVRAIDPDLPATFSPTLLQGVLRGRLGFRGVIVSDALDMAGASAATGIPEAAVRALAAGCDLLCLGSGTTHEQYLAVVAAVVAAVGTGRLDAARLEEASGRVRALGARSASPRPVPSPGTTDVAWGASLERGFALSEAARDWLAAPEPAAIVQVDSPTNQAVGQVPWGPAAAGPTTPADALPPGAKVAVVGRDLVPEHAVWALAERLRTEGRRVVVVECGWPRGGADLVSFGASRAVGMALTALLLGRADT